MAKKVLLTGGAGFIGSHTYAALRAAGYDVTVLDNFENADRDVPSRLAQIAGVPTPVIEADIRDRDAIDRAFADHGFDAVVHFAAKKSVPESEADPVGYYEANCGGLVNIVAAMRDNGVNTMVFSSSASVYGDPDEMPIREDTAPDPLSAYAATKLFGEQMLQRVAASHSEFKVGILRYFNPVGAHPSGLIGEDPQQTPTNLVPILAKVARGEMPAIKVFGSDYPTPEGTGIRDYIHVMDLARGHVLSLDRLFNAGESHLVNLGTGRGTLFWRS